MSKEETSVASTNTVFGQGMPFNATSGVEKLFGKPFGAETVSPFAAVNEVFQASPMGKELTDTMTQRLNQRVQIGSDMGLGEMGSGAKTDLIKPDQAVASVVSSVGGNKPNNTGAVFGRGGR